MKSNKGWLTLFFSKKDPDEIREVIGFPYDIQKNH